ncbi:NlpC/P60 family protein [Yinghuangia sp. ASG 101]|uniref:C40 family peptidase n=1 Tax=Yinghuangia sp. ASG 101 TaxID=2896848 RepID=UPI001E50CDD7|nr:C40 family peptidase [Yinghuangia sp. ASG 101]UGQ10947.1 NlpC/P60 family protein [Yinghuangia sp. ASG 101]
MKAGRWIVAAVAAGPLVLVAPVILVLAGTASGSCQTPSGGAADAEIHRLAGQVEQLLAGEAGGVQVPGLDDPAVQLPFAKTVVETGQALLIPPRGQIVALATALQESGLRNLAYGDRDSLGLFQQRPSQGWGTPEQIMDPVHASRAFYVALIRFSNWEDVSIGQAAQAVQKSAHPDAYDKWVPLATALQKAIASWNSQSAAPSSPLPTTATGVVTLPSAGPPVQAGLAGCRASSDGSQFGQIPVGALPEGYVVPTDAHYASQVAIRWALGQLGTPYQWGGSCLDARGPDPMARCDCSSLTQRAYAAAGITLSRTTYTQVGEGLPVSVDQLQPGDLVFTRGPATAPEHVGMVIGSGLIVHASQTGDVVRIATVADWRTQIVAARRIVT